MPKLLTSLYINKVYFYKFPYHIKHNAYYDLNE